MLLVADLCENSNTGNRANKPMGEADFERVERDLQSHIHRQTDPMEYLGESLCKLVEIIVKVCRWSMLVPPGGGNWNQPAVGRLGSI